MSRTARPDEPASAAIAAPEHANAATAALGLACAVAGAALVIAAATGGGGPWQIAGCAVYAATLVAVHTASTLSHAVRAPRPRHAMRTADQAMIFLFIAGSYTPVALGWLREGWWWALHVSIWGVALAGFASKALFAHRVQPGSVSTALYLLLGWMPIAAAWPIVAAIPVGLTAWMVAGGLCYTVGILFFRYDQRVACFHAVWHLCVVGGSACHFVGIWLYCSTPAIQA